MKDLRKIDRATIVRFFRDPEAPLWPKIATGLMLLYILWPADLFPDLIPLFGWFDDIGLSGITAIALIRSIMAYSRSLDNALPLPPREVDK